HRVCERDLVQRLDALLLLLQSIEHQLSLGLIEVEAGDFLGAGDGVDGDVSARRELGPEDSGEERRGETGAGEVRHEGAAVELIRHRGLFKRKKWNCYSDIYRGQVTRCGKHRSGFPVTTALPASRNA